MSEPLALDLGRMNKRRLWSEVLIVLGLSLGMSAVYSIVSIVERTTRQTSLSQQTATLNQSVTQREYFDLIYQFLSVFSNLVPVALVAFLLWKATRPHLSALGIDFQRPAKDAASGLALALVIGVPGIALYLLGRDFGITVNVIPTGLNEHWWTIPILLLSAARSGITEEVIVIGYLFSRLGTLGYGRWIIIISAALLRGSYHLYQGFGAFIGNFAMGLLFGWLYTRYKRLLPLVIAHFLIDAAVFVGYPWAAATFSWL